MKRNIILILMLFISCFVIAQTNTPSKAKKQKVFGIQLNPYWKSSDEKGWTMALRYAVDLHKHFSLGFELTGNTYDNPGYNNKKAGISLLMRYNIINTGKILWFTELDISAWYGYWEHKEDNEEYINNYPYFNSNTSYQQINWFFAPGLRIPFAKDKLSVDLMLKMSTEPVVFDNWKIAPTFRFNIHF